MVSAILALALIAAFTTVGLWFAWRETTDREPDDQEASESATSTNINKGASERGTPVKEDFIGQSPSRDEGRLSQGRKPANGHA